MNTHVLFFCKAIIFVSIATASSDIFASNNSDLQVASNAACEKMKMCIKKQVSAEQDMSPEMVKMIDNMAQSSCKSLHKINELTANDNLVDLTTKCYQALANSSCEAMEVGIQPKACIALEKAVEDL